MMFHHQRLHEQAAYSPKGMNITWYADYITLTTSHPQVKRLRNIGTAYLIISNDLLELITLKLSAEKLSATVSTTWIKETKFDPHIKLNN